MLVLSFKKMDHTISEIICVILIKLTLCKIKEICLQSLCITLCNLRKLIITIECNIKVGMYYKVNGDISLFALCGILLCLPTPLILICGAESDYLVFGPPASISLHLASSSGTPVGSVHKSRGDSVVRIWVQLKI